MASPPDEFLYGVRGALEDFCGWAAERAQPDASPLEDQLPLIRLALAGRLVDADEELLRITLEQPERESEVSIGRVVEGCIGMTKELPFNSQWQLYPYETERIGGNDAKSWVYRQLKVHVKLQARRLSFLTTLSADSFLVCHKRFICVYCRHSECTDWRIRRNKDIYLLPSALPRIWQHDDHRGRSAKVIRGLYPTSRIRGRANEDADVGETVEG